MAEILPKKLFGDVSPEIAKIFSRFKALDDQFHIRWSLAGRSIKAPDFAIFYQDQFAFLIAVSSLSVPEAETLLAPKLSLFAEKPVTIDNFLEPEQPSLSTFLEKLISPAISLGSTPLDGINCAILFPNVSQFVLNRIHKLKPSPYTWIGKESCASGEKLGATLKSLIRKPASRPVLDSVRVLFSPEIQIPKTILPKSSRPARWDTTAPALTRFLLDYDQEIAMKIDLALSGEAESAISAANPRLVTGVAGSGKTLVLLFRAALVSKLNPTKRCLVLTHNKPLIQDLDRRFDKIISDSAHRERIECIHFASWCRKFVADGRVLAPFERKEWIRSCAEQVPKAADLPLPFLCDEIDWIESYDVRTLADYLRARRVGRKRSLSEQQRRAVYSVLEDYRHLLREKNCLDWITLSSLLWERVRSGQHKLPSYDYVFVDEAQFFAPVALKLIRSIVEPTAGQLTLAADPTQGFLKRRESWAASGLNVRGRTIRLTRPYRNSRAILQYAADFYRRRLPDEDEEINLPNDEQIAQLHDGPSPETITVRALQDEVTRTCNEIRAALKAGASPADILIILSDKKGQQVDRILASLNNGKTIVADAQKKTEANAARLCSINAMTGLEAPIVFILGATDLLQIEQSLSLAPEELKEIVRDNTRKLFTAMTRASQRLVVFKRDGSPSPHLS
ncbi:MAG: UvrD-helicase domain-containing protein [Limisphaerales bacterium]